MTFVLDASIAVAWAFPDEHHPTADSALELLQHQDSLVPTLWWFEVRNALVAGERRGRIDGLTTGRFLQRLARLPVTLEHEPDESVLIDLARRQRLTV